MTGDLLFKRSIALQFGLRSGSQLTEVTGLSISFKIEKTSESAPNTTSITIFNLNEDNRRFFEAAKEPIANLLVGYGGVTEQIASGDITKAETVRNGPDFVTTLELGEGNKAVKEATVDKSFAPGATVRAVIEEAASALKSTANIATGSTDAVQDEVSQNGFSVSGLASTILDKFTKKQGLEWSIQDEELIILDPVQPTTEEAVLLTPETGLLGVPVVGKTGINFECLIIPKIKPGQLVQIKAKNYEGNVRTRKCIIEGEFRGNKWNMQCEGIEPGGST